MKKISVVLLLAVAMLLPLGASAGDVPDGADCRAGQAPVYSMGNEADRGQVCVQADYGYPYPRTITLLYIGGEASAENSGGMPCGAIIVAGQTVYGTDDWDNPDPDGNPNTNDGRHCD